MKPTNHPQVKLKGIEYLLLSIQSNPAKSQRWHLRRKYMYQHSIKDSNKGGSGAAYFRSPSYRNIVWYDASVQNVFYSCSKPIDGQTFQSRSGGFKSRSAQMHLTPAGWHRANEARKKIGLEPIRANHMCA
jgi:hypothetical protein